MKRRRDHLPAVSNPSRSRKHDNRAKQHISYAVGQIETNRAVYCSHRGLWPSLAETPSERAIPSFHPSLIISAIDQGVFLFFLYFIRPNSIWGIYCKTGPVNAMSESSLPTPPGTSHRREKENRAPEFSEPGPSTPRVVWAETNDYRLF